MANVKRSVIVGIVAVCMGAGIASAAQKKTSSSHSMSGCLEKGTGSAYMLTRVEGTGAQTVDIVGSVPTVNLSQHVGQKVQITGTAVSAKAAAKAEGLKTADTKEHHMRVSSLKMLATSCS